MPIDRGSIRVADFDVHKLVTDQEKIALRKEVSIVFQQYNLFPHKTALENVMMAPVHVLKENKDEVRVRAVALLKKVGLSAKADVYPGELSGRPAAARRDRALAGDAARGHAVRRSDCGARSGNGQGGAQYDSRARDEGMTCMLVTHEMRFARELADVVYFTDGGVIVESGPPAELFDRPVKERTRAFLSQIL